MTPKPKKFIDKFADDLFERGIETYNGALPEDQRSQNIGGAKPFWYKAWKSETDSPIVLNHPVFRAVLTSLPASLYSFSRVELDKEGKPVQLTKGNGYRRKRSCLMLYMQLDEDPNCGKNARALIIEKMKQETKQDFSAYIEVASEINSEKLRAAFAQITHRDFTGEDGPMKLHAAVFIALPSGAEGSSQLWSFRQKIQTRADAQMAASPEEVGELPI